MALLLGTIYVVTQIQKYELGRLKTLGINLALIFIFFSSFYLGLNSIEARGPARRYYQEAN